MPSIDADAVFAECRGNPLFAIEFARAAREGKGDLPDSLGGLIRDRVARLPVSAALVLRWAAVLGQTFTVPRLQTLLRMEPAELLDALEILERHGLIVADDGPRGGGDSYAFAHDLVRRAIYGDLSEPRRRLIHRRIAEALMNGAGNDESVAAEIVDHAALAGEMVIAARACVTAGRRCLRLFANTEAFAMARRGMRYAESLAEPDRLKLTLEAMEIALGARQPERPDETMRTLEALSEQAMDHGCMEHARLGFHLLSYLRWEGGASSDAQREMLRAEMVSRSADDGERVLAMAEAARCLALLERDLGQAESLLLEARALSRRIGVEPDAISDATGMLRLHKGALQESAAEFEAARAVARRNGDRHGEFQALEHLVAVELQRGRTAEAARLADELVALGSRFREGSEAPFAEALAALARYGGKQPAADSATDKLDAAIEELRAADSKFRLAFVLTRAALADLERGDASCATSRASEALENARAVDRPSEVTLARVALLRAAAQQGDGKQVREELAALTHEMTGAISAEARGAAEAALAAHGTEASDKGPGKVKGHGTRRRRAAV